MSGLRVGAERTKVLAGAIFVVVVVAVFEPSLPNNLQVEVGTKSESP